MRSALLLLIVGVLLSLLSACGWHLRGSDSSHLQQTLHLQGNTGDIYHEIEKTLVRHHWLAGPTEATRQIVLSDERFKRHFRSMNSQAQTTEYELILSITYEVRDHQGSVLINPTSVERSRYYQYHRHTATASDKQQADLRKEMAQQLAQHILRQIRFLDQ